MPKPAKISKGDGRKWTTLEQGTWLRDQIPSYLAAKSGGQRGLQVFWEKLFKGWFSQWPEAAAPSFLPPQADSTAAPAAAEEDADTMGITKLVCVMILLPYCFKADYFLAIAPQAVV
jgi:hypothetical protein